MAGQDSLFLGCGWAFPPRFSRHEDADGSAEGTVTTVAAEADIRQSLRILLATRRGERPLRPQFGLGLWERVFDRMDNTTLGDLKSEIEDAILRWEPRIKLEDVVFDTSEALNGVLGIELSYSIPQVNSRDNVVFPFFLNEGTSLPSPSALDAPE